MPPFLGAARKKRKPAGWGTKLTSTDDAEVRGVREIPAGALPPGAPKLVGVGITSAQQE